MDPAGARALARRIEEGKPQAEITPAGRLEGTGGTRHLGAAPQAITEENGVVFVRPRTARRRGDVRVFVRAADGRLHRLF